MAKRGRSNKTWRLILHWLGPVQRQRLLHNAWLEVIVLGCFVLVGAAAYEVTSVLVAHQHNVARQPEALVLAHQQLESLRTSDGLAAAEQCFDTNGAPRVATDPDVPCSYSKSGKPGCLDVTASYCYEARIVRLPPVNTDSTQPDVAANYQVQVSWSGRPVERGRVTLDYRIVEANSAYAPERTGRSGSGGPGTDATIGVANGVVGGVGTTLGGRFINTLTDIPGGPSVSVAAADCSAGSTCPVHKGTYDLSGHFAVSTNIPNKLITSCTWDFGDGTPVLQLPATQVGCFDGQVVTHSYATAWQTQHLPSYPEACSSPLGISLDSHTFSVNLTLHTIGGTDATSVSSHRTVIPGCST